MGYGLRKFEIKRPGKGWRLIQVNPALKLLSLYFADVSSVVESMERGSVYELGNDLLRVSGRFVHHVESGGKNEISSGRGSCGVRH